MPHKRAKNTVREQQRKERSALTFKPHSPSYFLRGTDLAPPGAGSTALSTEGIPKSVSRVLDAAKIRAEYRQKKRARLHEVDGGVDAPTTLAKAKNRRRAAADSGVGDKAATTATIEIRPGESLKHFNRCAFTCERRNPSSRTFFFLLSFVNTFFFSGESRTTCVRWCDPQCLLPPRQSARKGDRPLRRPQ